MKILSKLIISFYLLLISYIAAAEPKTDDPLQLYREEMQQAENSAAQILSNQLHAEAQHSITSQPVTPAASNEEKDFTASSKTQKNSKQDTNGAQNNPWLKPNPWAAQSKVNPWANAPIPSPTPPASTAASPPNIFVPTPSNGNHAKKIIHSEVLFMFCSYRSIMRISFLVFALMLVHGYCYASDDSSIENLAINTQNLVAGFGSTAIQQGLMNKAPTENPINIPTGVAQATYLLSPYSPLVAPLTQNLLSQIVSLGKDKNNDKLSLTWNPTSPVDSKVEEEPFKSVDMNSLLQPLVFDKVQEVQAKNVINALSGTLLPLNTINFDQLLVNLRGDKNKQLKAKLSEKQTQEYLAALRSYIAMQTVALGNLYQLYAERQIIDVNNLNPDVKNALKAVASQTKGPLSALQLENFMATHRIVDENWYKGLIHDNPASLQREQVELLAENLAESYQTRMTLERLLATMSVLILELNQQTRTQMQNQIQNMMNTPSQK